MVTISQLNQYQPQFLSTKKYDIAQKQRFTGKLATGFDANRIFFKKADIAFLGADGKTKRQIRAEQYLKNVLDFKRKKHPDFKFTNLSELDPRGLEGILDGIPVFEGMTIYDIYNMENLEFLLFMRGCKNQCSHCLAESKAPFAEMEWENVLKLADGLEELKNRMGFLPINAKRSIYSISSLGFIPYFDSDPLAIQAKDANGTPHNIAEIAELYHKKTGLPFGIVTAGWDKDQPESKQAALDLVSLLKKEPKALRGIEISCHPFHKWMTKSIKTLDPSLKKYYRQQYINRMTDVIVTFLPAIKDERCKIRFEDIKDVDKLSPFSINEVRKLAEEIIDNVVNTCKDQNMPEEDYMFIKNDINKHSRIDTISDKGRADRLFKTDKLKTIYKLDSSGNELKLLISNFNSIDKVIGTLYSHYKYPVVSKYIFNIDLDTSKNLINDKENIKKLVENLWKLQKLFLDHKATINIESKDKETQAEFMNNFNEAITKFFGKHYSYLASALKDNIKTHSVDFSKFDKEINFVTDIYNFIPDGNQNKADFTKLFSSLVWGYMKGVNPDGSIFLKEKEAGGFKKNGFKVKGFKLNFDKSKQAEVKENDELDKLKVLNIDTKEYIINNIDKDVIKRDKENNLIPPEIKEDENTSVVSFCKKLEAVI